MKRDFIKPEKIPGFYSSFPSLKERIRVLADKGIYEKIEQETLNKFAITVSQGIKRRPCVRFFM